MLTFIASIWTATVKTSKTLPVVVLDGSHTFILRGMGFIPTMSVNPVCSQSMILWLDAFSKSPHGGAAGSFSTCSEGTLAFPDLFLRGSSGYRRRTHLMVKYNMQSTVELP